MTSLNMGTPAPPPGPMQNNGNAGSLLPQASSLTTQRGGSTFFPAQLPQVSGITLKQEGPSKVIVLEGGV